MHKTLIKTLSICLLLTSFTACQRIDQLEKRISDIENTVSDLKQANDRLQQKMQEGKLVTSCESLPENKGWKFTFSDNTSFQIENAASALTPMMRANTDGTWSVSYDNGSTYKTILDNEGKPLKSKNSQLRLNTDTDGNYVLESFLPADPDIIIHSYMLPMAQEPATLIKSIVHNDANRTVTITMQDNSVFVFGRRVITPTSIALLSDRIKLIAGSTACLEFRVNPSDAVINYDLNSPDCQIELDRASITKNGYVTTPTNYRLVSIEQAYGEEGRLLEGQYRAYIQDTGKSSDYDEQVALVLNLRDDDGKEYQISSQTIRAYYSHTVMTSFRFRMEGNATVRRDVSATIDGNSITVLTPFISDATSLVPTFETSGGKVSVAGTEQTSGASAQDFSKGPVEYVVTAPTGDSHTYRVNVRCSQLPVVFIQTPGKTPVTSKEEWMQDASITIYNTDGSIDYQNDKLQIKGRGNTNWSAPKKPYALKLDAKAKVLGMPKHKRWILLANWYDPTLLRNHTAFAASRMTSLPYTVRGQYVELVFNDEHVGNYYLCEQIKIDENRVNITSMKKTDISGEAVTGGYLVEMDGYFDEVNKFRSAIKNLPYQFKEPDEEDLQPEQFEYFQNFINNMETEMYADDWLVTGKYRDYIDLQSWADRWMVHEVTGNPEDWDPRSAYVYKDRGGKLCAGPVWDYDYATFWHAWAETFVSKPYIYYPRLFRDPAFTAIVKERWEVLKPLFQTLPDYIRSQAEMIRVSCEIDNTLWKRVDDYYGMIVVDADMTFDEAVDELIYYVNTKIAFMDREIQNNI